MAVAAMKHIGILGTIIPSLKTLFKFKKIFTQLTLTLILPLVIIFLTNIDITNRFYHYNGYNPYQMLFQGYFIYITYDGSYGGSYHKAGQPTYSHVLLFIHLFSILMITLFYILTTITIVYTITAKDVLSSVISVVEESCYGLRLVKKAMKLVKGNMLAACMVSLAMYVLIGSVVFIYTALVVYNGANVLDGSPFGGGSSRGQRQRRGEDVVHPLKVSLEYLYNGTSKKLYLLHSVLYSKCKGKGSKSGASMKCACYQGSGMKVNQASWSIYDLANETFINEC
ncbi:hypothetical protein Tco_0671132 [Tanacetum coccineum]